MPLGLGAGLTKGGIIRSIPGIVTDGLVMKHMYPAGAVQKLSDGAAYFNGTSEYIAIGAKPVDTADATYVFWHNSNVSGSQNRAIFGHGGDAQGEFSLAYNSSGQALLYLKNDLYQYWDDGAGNLHVSDGKWHHVAVVVDIDSMPDCKLYIDGVEIPQGSRSTSGTATAYGNMEIGRASATTEFQGYLCNFGVWTGALTQAEIKSIMFKQYADLSTNEKTSLVSFWNLDSTVADDIPLIYDENNTTLGANLWDGGDVGPDSLGDADGHPSHSMDISDVGLAAGDVIKLSATISGSNGGRIICPDVAAGSNGVTRIPADVTNSHTTDGDIVRYLYVSDVTGVLKIRTDFDGSGNNQDDRTQKITNISIQKITSAGRLV